MPLITAEYAQQNRQLHSDPDFGHVGQWWAKRVYSVCEEVGSMDVLDYGCGKRGLEKKLGFKIKNYDPAIEGLETAEPAAVVACFDVLEHVEPDCLEDVLDHLKSLTQKAGIFSVTSIPAKRILPDGRNAHLIQEPFAWWFQKIESRFRLCVFNELVDGDKVTGFAVIVKPK